MDVKRRTRLYCSLVTPVCPLTDRGNEFCHRPNLRGHAVVGRDRNKKIAGATIRLDINDLNLTVVLVLSQV